MSKENKKLSNKILKLTAQISKYENLIASENDELYKKNPPSSPERKSPNANDIPGLDEPFFNFRVRKSSPVRLNPTAAYGQIPHTIELYRYYFLPTSSHVFLKQIFFSL